MTSLPYRSAYSGRLAKRGNGEFDHFFRQLTDFHKQYGVWLFASTADEQLAYLHGFHNPESILQGVAYGHGTYNNIKLRWVPGDADENLRKELIGSASQHLKDILDIRQYLALPLSLRDQVPVYPIDARLKAYWDGKRPVEPSTQLQNAELKAQNVPPWNQPYVSPFGPQPGYLPLKGSGPDKSNIQTQHKDALPFLSSVDPPAAANISSSTVATFAAKPLTSTVDRHAHRVPSDERLSRSTSAEGRKSFGMTSKQESWATTGASQYKGGPFQLLLRPIQPRIVSKSPERPRCQRCVKSKKACDRQRPCGGCKSLYQCISEDESDTKRARRGRRPKPPAKAAATAPQLDSDTRMDVAEYQVAGEVTSSKSLQEHPKTNHSGPKKDAEASAVRSSFSSGVAVESPPVVHSISTQLETRSSGKHLAHNTICTILPQFDQQVHKANATFKLQYQPTSSESSEQSYQSAKSSQDAHDTTYRPFPGASADVYPVEIYARPNFCTQQKLGDASMPQSILVETQTSSTLSGDETERKDLPIESNVLITGCATNGEITTQSPVIHPTSAATDIEMMEAPPLQLAGQILDHSVAAVTSISDSSLFARSERGMGSMSPPRSLTSEATQMPKDRTADLETTEKMHYGSNTFYYLDLPCVDCEEVVDHRSDCHIGMLKPMSNLTVLDYRDLADAAEKLNQFEHLEVECPVVGPDYDGPLAPMSDLAEIIRHEESYKNDADLHYLPDSALILLWAFKLSGGVEIVRDFDL